MGIALGLDFGREYIRMAYIGKDNKPYMVCDDNNRYIVRNKIGYDKSSASFIVGNYLNLSADEGNKSIEDIYIKLGREDFLHIDGKKYYVQELCSMILKKLRDFAESTLKDRITSVCISVSPYFDSTQRMALLQASKIAGLKVVRIANKQSACMLAISSLYNAIGSVHFMYTDSYGHESAYYEIDDNLIRSVGSFGGKRTGITFEGKTDEKLGFLENKIIKNSSQAYKIAADKLKEDYTSFLYCDTDEYNYLRQRLGIKYGLSGRDLPDISDFPAVGAALLALRYENDDIYNQICGKTVLEYCAMPISLVKKNGEIFEIIPRDYVYPCSFTYLFSNSQILQFEADTSILMGEEKYINDNRFIGYLEVTGMKKHLLKKEYIDISFNLNKDGILDVKAISRDHHSNVNAYVTTQSFMDEGEIISAIENLNRQLKAQNLTLANI